MKGWRCHCGAEFDRIADAIKHARKKHPDDGYACLDQFGSVGDSFADGAIARLEERHRKSASLLRSELEQLREKQKGHDALVASHNNLVRAFRAIDDVMALLRKD